MFIRFSTVSVLALAAAAWGGAVAGQGISGCVPDMPVQGDQVSCTADGIGLTGQTPDLRIEVAAGVTLEAADVDTPTFDLGSGSWLGNDGTLSSVDPDATTVTAASGASVAIRNRGEILSPQRKAISLEGTLELDNSGLIASEHKAVEVEFASGDTQGDARIRNSGTIRARDHKTIDVDGDLALDNSGVIDSYDKAVEADGLAEITNTGAIMSLTHKAVDIQGALMLHNTGLIVSGLNDLAVLNGLSDPSGLVALSSGDGNDGVEAGEGSRIVNSGRILSSVDRGIDAEGEGAFDDADAYAAGKEVSVHNTGTGVVWSHDDAVRVRGDSTVVNHGMIASHDQEGIEAGDWNDVTVINRGTIAAGDEGIQSNNGLRVENYGLITSYDDGVQGQLGMFVLNHGTIHIRDHQGEAGRALDGDGVDMDGGEVWNFGTILVESMQDGVDVDTDTVIGSDTIVADVLVMNAGRIEGHTAVNTDDGNTGRQIVRSSGQLVGRSGVALRLGYGDDVVEITGGTVTGDITTGFGGTDAEFVPVPGDTRPAGNDSVRISGGVVNGNIATETGNDSVVLSGGVVNGTIDTGAGDDSVVLSGGLLNGNLVMGAGDNSLFVFGGDVTGTIDMGAEGTSRFAARGLRDVTLRFAQLPDLVDLERNVLIDAASGMLVAADPETFSTADDLARDIGYGLTTVPLRLPQAEGAGQGTWVSGLALADFDDGATGTMMLGHDYGRFGLFGGMSRGTREAVAGDVDQDLTFVGARYLGGPLTGALWVGLGESDLPLGGRDETSDLTMIGAGLRYAMPMSGPLSLAFEAGLTHARFDAVSSRALAGATFGDRSTTAGHVGAEAQLATTTDFTPFAGLQWSAIDGEAVSMSLGQGRTGFDSEADDRGTLTLGVDYAGAPGIASRLELRLNTEGDHAVLLGGSYRF